MDKIDIGIIGEMNLLAEKGFLNASKSLAMMVQKKTEIKVVQTEMVDFNCVIDTLYGPEQLVTTVVMGLEGDLSGNIALIFDNPGAFELTDLLYANPKNTTKSIDDSMRTAIMETGNIIGSSFLNEMAKSYDIQVFPTVPEFCCDMLGPLIETIVIEYSFIGDKALLMRAKFRIEEKSINAHLIFLPSPDTLDILIKKMEVS